MMTLCKKFPVVYHGKKYYAKLFKYSWQKYKNECRTRIYKRVLFFNIRLHEEGCSYSTELKDNDYQYFVEETIKRYLKLKEHENANKKAFKIWNGKCS